MNEVKKLGLPPFVEIIDSNDIENPGGFMAAMFKTIAHWMQLNVTWVRESEDKYGTWENDTWTGMCGMLFREEVDIILNPLLPSSDYAQVAYYTNPVIYEAFTFLSGKKKQEAGLFLYFSVLEPIVWASIGVALVVVVITSALLFQKIYHEKWNAWMCTLGQYMWVYVTYMLRQVPSEKWILRAEKSLLSFWMVVLITIWVLGVSFLVMTVFQSLLVSKLTIVRTQPVVDTMKDLVSKSRVKGLVPVEIELQEVLKDSGIPLYEEAWTKLESTISTSDEVLSDASFHEVQRGAACVVHGQLILKFILHDYFQVHGRCDFHLSENYFFPFPLLMAMRKTLPRKFQQKFNMGLSQLVASDISGKWFKSIFRISKLCTSYSENDLKPLALKNILGVLVIWAVGTTLSVFCLIGEIFLSKWNRGKLLKKNLNTR